MDIIEHIAKLYSEIDEGKAGNRLSLKTGMKKFDKLVGGLQQSVYAAIMGLPGAAKTSFMLYIIYSCVENLRKQGDLNKLNVIFFTLEMPIKRLLSTFLSIHIMEKKQMTITFTDMMSFTDKIDNDSYSILLEYREWLEEFMQNITLIETPLTPQNIDKHLCMYLGERGDLFIDEESNEIVSYELFRKDQINLCVIDHLGLVTGAGSPKENMDKISKKLVTYRNLTTLSSIVLLQQTRQSTSTDRRKLDNIEPELQDGSNTANVGQDVDLFLAVFNPNTFKRSDFAGYNISILENNFRSLHILKHRNGMNDLSIGYAFFGGTATFKELPIANKMIDADYGEIISLRQKLEDFDAAKKEQKEERIGIHNQAIEGSRIAKFLNDSTNSEEFKESEEYSFNKF